MKEYLSFKTDSIKYLKIADHLLTMTYPIVQDPKLLKIILKNLYLSMSNAVDALLIYEKDNYKIENFKIKLNKTAKYFRKHDISLGYIDYLDEINNLIIKQDKADVEFIRKEKFVFTSMDYKLNIITKKDMKDYIIKGKMFLKKILEVIK